MDSMAINYASQALYLVLIISLPPIVIASVIGILVSLLQAVTQLQEQTLTFGVKLVCVVVTIFLMGGWMSGELLRYADEIFSRFYLL
ncbi:type III secretion system export apparatus subunit SctS [uncultured Mailhella sp.]|uniref:type III secretion system export apparatus subunit SctS n=1 Tax=uncultured Mailhella sp. TaxID=1981031 RepID=UPI002623C15F|nr:type III secretion system export apparatus subunit SctS [uncultured Mailhella sp.]